MYFQNYVLDTKSNPIIVEDWVGGMAKQVQRRKERPLTIEGFANWLGNKNIVQVLDQYFQNRDNHYVDFIDVCARIKMNIRQDQIEGGMAGIYNPNITQRLNGLVEKTEDSGKKDITIKVKYGVREGNIIEQSSFGSIENIEGSEEV